MNSNNECTSKKLCDVCYIKVDKHHYSRHLKSHKENLKCIQCSNEFNRQDNLVRHMKLHPPVKTNDCLYSEKITIDEEKIKTSIINFHVKVPDSSVTTIHCFKHPFTCKVMGPRGSGKTCFMVSYVQQVACLMFSKILIATSTPDQILYQQLKDIKQIQFIEFDNLDKVVEESKDILIVLDDAMQAAKNNRTLENLHTRGRHQSISLMCLEQDLFYSNYVERRNVDYFVITKIRDTSCLDSFYKRFCQDVQQWRFIDLYEFAMMNNFGYLIIDFISNKYKYRVNSLNIYFDTNKFVLKYIYDGDKSDLEYFNHLLKTKFLSRNGKFHDYNTNKKNILPLGGLSQLSEFDNADSN